MIFKLHNNLLFYQINLSSGIAVMISILCYNVYLNYVKLFDISISCTGPVGLSLKRSKLCIQC